MNSRFAVLLVFLLALSVSALIYGVGVRFPPVFDDGDLIRLLKSLPVSWLPDLTPRGLGFYTLKIAYQFSEEPLYVARLTSIVLHVLVGVVMYNFMLVLLRLGGREPAPFQRWLALLAVLLFVAHPLSVYAIAYLAQRTVVMATLFALLMWWAFGFALLSGRGYAMLISVCCYAAALMSKEHAITAPVVSALMLTIFLRNGGVSDRRLWRRVGLYFLACSLLAVFAVFWFKGLIGRLYEPLGGSLNVGDARTLARGADEHVYAYSLFNQTGMLLEYLKLWILPNPLNMSIDMRPPFSWNAFDAAALSKCILVLLAFAGSVYGLLRGKPWMQWLGFGFLGFYGLFWVEYSVVRLQEPMVLYRAYFWMIPAFAVLWAVPERSARRVYALLAVMVVFFALFSAQRVQTFSSMYAVWNDAVSMNERRGWTEGVSRAYANRALALAHAGRFAESVRDYDRAIAGSSGEFKAYNWLNRARALIRWGKFDAARESAQNAYTLFPTMDAVVVRALAADGMGLTAEARSDFESACDYGYKKACQWLEAEQRARVRKE